MRTINSFVVLIFAAIFYLNLHQNLALAQGCLPSTAHFDLNINNVEGRVLNGGDMWWDPATQEPHYEVPIGSGFNSLFAGGLWLGAIDSFGQLRIAAQTYRQTGNDYFPGILNDNGQINAATCEQYDRIWSVLGSDIDAFLAAFAAGGGNPLPTSAIPESILKWPGRNNPHFSDFALPANKDLAPFYDGNSDNIYDPTVGDYPVIASGNPTYADQMAWCVFNDAGNTHTQTSGMPLQVEVGLLAYAFAEQANPTINNATFYRYTLRNYNPTRLDSCIVAMFVDPDLGDYLDDYVGCIPNENVGYAYNCTPADGLYGQQPPIVAIHFLDPINDANGQDTSLDSFVYWSNNFTSMGNPQDYDDYYGYMNAVWKDGTPFTVGGNGYGGTEPTHFMFPDNPSQTNGWSECAMSNSCGDRRFLLSSHPISIPRYGVKNFTMGVYFVPGAGGCPNVNINLLSDAIEQSTNYHENLSLLNVPEVWVGTGSANQINAATPPFKALYDAKAKICHITAVGYGCKISVYDILGRQIIAPTTVTEATQINTYNWQQGCYWIASNDQSGRRYTQKVVVY